jgi:hypothetical protein
MRQPPNGALKADLASIRPSCPGGGGARPLYFAAICIRAMR